MRGLNKVIIAGNLARDPDVRHTVDKRAYARFSVAVNTSYKTNSGEYKETVDYISVIAWGSWAESCGKYLKKGSPVLIEGRLKTGSYEAKDGSGKRYTTDVNLENMVMLGSGQQNQNQNSNNGSYSRPSAPQEWPGVEAPPDEAFGRPLSEAGFFGGSSNIPSGENAALDEHTIPF